MDTIKRSLKKKLNKLINELVDTRTAPIDDPDYEPSEWAENAREQLSEICRVSHEALDEILKSREEEIDGVAAPGQQVIK